MFVGCTKGNQNGACRNMRQAMCVYLLLDDPISCPVGLQRQHINIQIIHFHTNISLFLMLYQSRYHWSTSSFSSLSSSVIWARMIFSMGKVWTNAKTPGTMKSK